MAEGGMKEKPFLFDSEFHGRTTHTRARACTSESINILQSIQSHPGRRHLSASLRRLQSDFFLGGGGQSGLDTPPAPSTGLNVLPWKHPNCSGGVIETRDEREGGDGSTKTKMNLFFSTRCEICVSRLSPCVCVCWVLEHTCVPPLGVWIMTYLRSSLVCPPPVLSQFRSLRLELGSEPAPSLGSSLI